MDNYIECSLDVSVPPKGILVVEDDAALRFTLSEWLRMGGYIVYESANADDAIVALASPVVIDLVITDVDMPGSMNGLGLLNHINNVGAGVSVIVVSGKYPGRLINDRNVQFFSKPYHLPTVSAHIASVLRI